MCRRKKQQRAYFKKRNCFDLQTKNMLKKNEKIHTAIERNKTLKCDCHVFLATILWQCQMDMCGSHTHTRVHGVHQLFRRFRTQDTRFQFNSSSFHNSIARFYTCRYYHDFSCYKVISSFEVLLSYHHYDLSERTNRTNKMNSMDVRRMENPQRSTPLIFALNTRFEYLLNDDKCIVFGAHKGEIVFSLSQ